MTYRDANGNEFESFAAACHHYGVDTPAEALAEEIEINLHEASRFVGPRSPNDVANVGRMMVDYTKAVNAVKAERGEPGLPCCCVLKKQRPPIWPSIANDEIPF